MLRLHTKKNRCSRIKSSTSKRCLFFALIISILSTYYYLNFIIIVLFFSKFHLWFAINKYRESVWIQQMQPSNKNIYYFSFYSESYWYKKIMKEYNLDTTKFHITQSKEEILNRCLSTITLSWHKNLCDNGLVIYPNYWSFHWEIMFIEK